MGELKESIKLIFRHQGFTDKIFISNAIADILMESSGLFIFLLCRKDQLPDI